jgi:hypothetical protein
MSTLGTWCGHACVCVCGTYDSSSANLVEIIIFLKKRKEKKKGK